MKPPDIGESPAAARGPPEIGAREIEEDTCPTRGECGKPPAGGRFQKVQSGNPCGPRGKNLPGAVGRHAERAGVGHDRQAPAQQRPRPVGRQIDHGRFARNQDADRRGEEGRTEGRLGPWCSTMDKVNTGARMVPLYAARIEVDSASRSCYTPSCGPDDGGPGSSPEITCLTPRSYGREGMAPRG
jgi:hypothetical protein